MSIKSRPALLSILVVVALSVGVFASSSFALQGVTVAQTDVLDGTQSFSQLRLTGAVKPDNVDKPAMYAMSFKAVFRPGDDAKVDIRDATGLRGDVVIEQSMFFPTLAGSPDFVGPVRLPFASERLAVKVFIPGDCFVPDRRNGFRVKDGSCAEATLTLGAESFDVTDLLLSVNARFRPIRGNTWTLRASAEFAAPGYAFPIASLGGGGTTLVVGDFGGTVGMKSIGFGG